MAAWLETSKFTVLLHGRHRSRSSNKVEVEYATNGVVLEILVARSVLVNQDIHSIGVEEQDTMRTCRTVL